ncbi:MAG: metallophosphoesterase [Candidatus Pacearchaeota archaeon]
MKRQKNYEKCIRKTKVLAIGDIHGDIDLVERLVERVKKENIDIIILAGDLTFEERSVEGLIGPFVKEKKSVLLIPGNHESGATIEFLAQKYNVKNLHGYGFEKNGIGFFGAGTANIGIHQIGDENIFRLLEKSHDEIKNTQKKVMITHIHPLGSKIDKLLGFQGSKAVRDAIEKFQPDITITAHIHEMGGLQEKIGKTKVINVSRKEVVFEI